MPVDIVRHTLTDNPRIPFDWAIAAAGASSAPHNYVIYPCQGIVAAAEAIQINALVPESTLDTAVITSLFSDCRATDDDVLPFGQTDRRGWCGDELSPLDNDQFGSRLWIGPGKTTDERRDAQQFAALEALQWLVRTGVASNVTVDAEWLDDSRLALRPRIYRDDEQNPVYDVVWATTIRSHPNA